MISNRASRFSRGYVFILQWVELITHLVTACIRDRFSNISVLVDFHRDYVIGTGRHVVESALDLDWVAWELAEFQEVRVARQCRGNIASGVDGAGELGGNVGDRGS